MSEIVATIIALLISAAAVFHAGKAKGKAAEKDKAAQSRADTIERAKNAYTGNPDGSGDADWLRKRGK